MEAEVVDGALDLSEGLLDLWGVELAGLEGADVDVDLLLDDEQVVHLLLEEHHHLGQPLHVPVAENVGVEVEVSTRASNFRIYSRVQLVRLPDEADALGDEVLDVPPEAGHQQHHVRPRLHLLEAPLVGADALDQGDGERVKLVGLVRWAKGNVNVGPG